MGRVAVALSGGGHRATLFGLGALLYLTDAGINHEVVCIASVSGGSLANGFVAQELDYRATTAPDVRRHAARLARRVAVQGTLWGAALTRVYLGVLVVLVGWTAVGVWVIPAPTWLHVVGLVASLVALAVVAGLRGVVCAHALAKTLFSTSTGATLLGSVSTSIDHVVCATDLHAGEHTYFSGSLATYGAPSALVEVWQSTSAT